MKIKTKKIEKITAGIFVVGATFFGLLTSSITSQSNSIKNLNLTTYKRNKENDAEINTLKSKIKGKGEIIQTSMSTWTSSALVQGLDNKTHLYMWGANNYGQQGDGKTENVKTPTEVKFNKNVKNIIQISMSIYTSSALVQGLDNKTHLYMWGYNYYGQQGDGTTNNIKTPREVTHLNKFLSTGATITQISISYSTSSALIQGNDNKTQLYMWGANDMGQQGDGTTNNVSTPKEVTNLNRLKNVKNITKISISGRTSSALVLDDKGKTHLYMWGWNEDGQQGDQTTNDIKAPKEVEFDNDVKNITQISMSNSTSSALVQGSDNKTHLYIWGDNTQQGGSGKTKDVKIPTEVTHLNKFLPTGATITQISMSILTSSVLIQDNDKVTHLYMWGNNEYGQQGDKKPDSVITPTKVKFFDSLRNESKITQISMSSSTSSALVKDDRGKTHLYMWGRNDYSQQGDGKTENVKTPKDIWTLEPELKDVQAIDIKTTQIGDGKVSIEFNLKEVNASLKRDVKLSDLWITDDSGNIIKIQETSLGYHKVEISGLSYGTYSKYTIHVKYKDAKYPKDFEIKEKFFTIPSFAIPFSTIQIVWIFLGVLLFTILSGLTIGFLYKKKKQDKQLKSEKKELNKTKKLNKKLFFIKKELYNSFFYFIIFLVILLWFFR